MSGIEVVMTNFGGVIKAWDFWKFIVILFAAVHSRAFDSSEFKFSANVKRLGK